MLPAIIHVSHDALTVLVFDVLMKHALRVDVRDRDRRLHGNALQPRAHRVSVGETISTLEPHIGFSSIALKTGAATFW